MVLDSVRVKAHAFDLCPRAAIVLSTDSIIEDKFGSTFGSIDLDRKHGRRPDQDSVGAFLGHNERPFFYTEASTELCRKHDRAAATDLAG